MPALFHNSIPNHLQKIYPDEQHPLEKRQAFLSFYSKLD